MRRSSATTFFLTGQFLLAALVFGQGAAYKTVPGSASGVSQIPQSLQAVLESPGVQFENAQGAPVCEIWWRKDIPTQKSAASSADILYSGLTVGELAGVLHFPSANKDYRGQTVKPGYYTLRYALIPQDGNHMGVSSYRDFLLLTPVAHDANPSQNLSFSDLLNGSRMTTGTGHPAVMMLDPVSQSAGLKFPSAVQDDQGNWTLDVKLNVKPAGGSDQQLPFAMVLVGQYQG